MEITGSDCARPLTLAIAAALAVSGLSIGCQREERVLDIEAPGVDVEVDRHKDTGELDIDIKSPD
jgi:hypothetical protein